eukprot:1003036_1
MAAYASLFFIVAIWNLTAESQSTQSKQSCDVRDWITDSVLNVNGLIENSSIIQPFLSQYSEYTYPMHDTLVKDTFSHIEIHPIHKHVQKYTQNNVVIAMLLSNESNNNNGIDISAISQTDTTPSLLPCQGTMYGFIDSSNDSNHSIASNAPRTEAIGTAPFLTSPSETDNEHTASTICTSNQTTLFNAHGISKAYVLKLVHVASTHRSMSSYHRQHVAHIRIPHIRICVTDPSSDDPRTTVATPNTNSTASTIVTQSNHTTPNIYDICKIYAGKGSHAYVHAADINRSDLAFEASILYHLYATTHPFSINKQLRHKGLSDSPISQFASSLLLSNQCTKVNTDCADSNTPQGSTVYFINGSVFLVFTILYRLLSSKTFITFIHKHVKGFVFLTICLAFTSCHALRIAGGRGHTCALSRHNRVKCFGWGQYGQLGYGGGATEQRGDNPNEMGEHLPEVDLGSDFNVTHISAGYYHNCALSSAHTIKCWGRNVYGPLGYGDESTRGDNSYDMGDNLPEVDLGTNFEVLQVVTGRHHTCALSRLGTVKCFGRNGYGQLGYGDTRTRGDESGEMGDNLPEVDLGTNFKVTMIVAGILHLCALSDLNEVKCWGDNYDGQLGYGDTNFRGDNGNEMGNYLPKVDLGTDFNVIHIVAGLWHTCVLSSANAVKCFGRSENGMLGYGNTNIIGASANQMGDNLPEVDLGTDFHIRQIVASKHGTCVLSTANAMKCYGLNNDGQLGYGDTINRGDSGNEMGDNLPEVDLGTDFNAIRIDTGYEHVCAISELNTVKCYGLNDHGQLGYGDVHNRGDGANEMGNNLLLVDIGQGFATRHPTSAPSGVTYSPTSASPTRSPSPAPTTCFDFDNNRDNNGEDGYSSNVRHVVQHLLLDNEVYNDKILIAGDGMYVREIVNILEDNVVQELQCTGSVSCFESTITFKNNSICNIHCNNTLSCYGSSIFIEHCDNVHVICNGEQSCDGATLLIESGSNGSQVNVECGAITSCQNMNISIINNASTFANISCIDYGSCDNINIKVNDANNSRLQLYSHSDNVFFDNGFGW